MSGRRESVSERAERAGAYLALRAEALRSHPSVLAVFRTEQQVAESQRVAWLERQLDSEMGELPELDLGDPDDRAVDRMSRAAAADDGYRVQLIDLAAEHGGVYERALDLLYAIEVRELGRWQAMGRHLLDRHQLNVTRERDAGG